MLDEPPRPEAGIVPWSHWKPTAATAVAVRIERYTGARGDLRRLFEEAEDSAQQIDSYLESGDVLAAIAHDRVIGHLQLTETADANTGEIKNMAVESGHRGRGVGLALIDAAIQRTREGGHSRLVVSTAAADFGNPRFYQRAGFRLRSVERDAFLPDTGYPVGATIDGVPLRDRVWLDLRVVEEV